MLRNLFLTVAVFVLISLAFGGGYAVGAAKIPFTVSLIGHNNPSTPPVPAWSEWTYPGSEPRGTNSVHSLETNDLTQGLGHCETLATSDSFDAVYAFYRGKIHAEANSDIIPESLSDGAGGTGGQFEYSSTGGFDGRSAFYRDSTRSQYLKDQAKYSLRPLRMATLGMRTGSAFVTVVITRAKDEPLTHVQIVRDFAGMKPAGK